MTDTTSGQAATVHKEAFCRMKYRCEACGKWEWIWNSRDGVTPFIVGSKCCKASAQHVLWQDDEFVPNHQLASGDRFFRDGTVDDAVAITLRQFDNYAEQGHAVPDDIKAMMLEDARQQTSPSWERGWPYLEIAP